MHYLATAFLSRASRLRYLTIFFILTLTDDPRGLQYELRTGTLRKPTDVDRGLGPNT